MDGGRGRAGGSGHRSGPGADGRHTPRSTRANGGNDRGLVEEGGRGASTLKMDTVLAEELDGLGREGWTGETLMALHGHGDQLVQKGLGREGGRRIRRVREMGGGSPGVVEDGVGDEGRGVGDVMGGSHDASNAGDEMNSRHDNEILIDFVVELHCLDSDWD